MITKFSIGNIQDDKMAKIIKAGVMLTNVELNKYANSNFLVKPVSMMQFSNTEQENAEYLKELYDCCAKYSIVSKLPQIKKTPSGDIDWNEKENLATAMQYSDFKAMYFAIVTQVLETVNAKNEVEDIMVAANVSYVPLGDSKTFEVESKALYKIQNGAYGNLYSVYQEHLRSGQTLVPKPKIAAISFNVAQMTPLNYNFGKEMSKLALSFRVRMYNDIVDVLFTVSNVSSTVFYKPNFAKPTFLELVDRISGVNGGLSTAVYGTKQAIAKMSDNVSGGFRAADEKIKTGYIDDLYGVPVYKFSQAVDSNTASATFRVPNNRVILMSAIGDKPVKLVKEDYMFATFKDGKDTTLWNQVYTLNDSWNVGYIMSGVYGIQMV